MTSHRDPTSRRRLVGVWLGRRPYEAVFRLQNELLELRKRALGDDVVLLVEHEPVITLGRGAQDEHLLASPAMLNARGVQVVVTDRGGDVTLHAPGQLVAYPIVALSPAERDVRRYVRGLAEVMRELVAPLGIDGGSIDGLIGLWVDQRQPHRWRGQHEAVQPVKLGAIGVRISKWVTMHGFALNVSNDLSLFHLIVPCGITEHGVSSVAALTHQVDVELLPLARQAHHLLAQRLEREAPAFYDASRQSLDDLMTHLRREFIDRT